MPLQIQIFQGRTPPPYPDGVSIVIDVIRAFTTSHYAFQQGIKKIYLAGTVAEAFELKQQYPGCVLAGEQYALPIEGFDFGNSPWEILHAQLNTDTLVQLTTNGVAALLHCEASMETYACGFTSARETALYVKQRCQEQGISKVQLVASHPTGEEDMACAEYMQAILQGNEAMADPEKVSMTVYHSKAAEKFLNHSHSRLKAEDIEYAMTEKDHGLIQRCSFNPAPCLTPINMKQ